MQTAKQKYARTNVRPRLDDIDIAVATTLRQLRLIRGASQNELAHHLGISFQQVQKYEKGQNRMGASTLYRTADFFGISIEDLFVTASLKRKRRGSHSNDGECIAATIFPVGGNGTRVPDEDIILAIAEFQKIRDRPSRAAILQLIKCISVQQ